MADLERKIKKLKGEIQWLKGELHKEESEGKKRAFARENPRLKKHIIFHGGCLECYSPLQQGLGGCLDCKYFDSDWAKPDKSYKHPVNPD